MQLVLTDRTALTQNIFGGIVSRHIWRFADLSTRLDFLLAGFGWCNMPAHAVAEHIAAGRLKKLEIANQDATSMPICVVHGRGRAPGRAGRWLIADLRERMITCPGVYHSRREPVEELQGNWTNDRTPLGVRTRPSALGAAGPPKHESSGGLL